MRGNTRDSDDDAPQLLLGLDLDVSCVFMCVECCEREVEKWKHVHDGIYGIHFFYPSTELSSHPEKD